MAQINWIKLLIVIKSKSGEERVDYVKNFLRACAADDVLLSDIAFIIADAVDEFEI